MIKYLLLFFNLLVFLIDLHGQGAIGIGIAEPNPDAILHIRAPTYNKGVLFPGTSTLTIGSINSQASGLFLYDTTFHRYAYLKGNQWMYLNPWDTDVIGEGNTTGADEDISGISTPYEVTVNNTLKANRLEGDGVVPVGGIIMWSGAIEDIPSNFALCDGRMKGGVTTPNLVGRFIRAGASADLTGGGVNNSGTSQISYVSTPQYMIDNSIGCEQERYLFSFTFQEICEIPGEPLIVTTRRINNKPANTCAKAQSGYRTSNDNSCRHNDFSDCTKIENPEYYMTNAACRNPGVEVVNAVTNADNRPAYYDLAYIMRVE
ncbi:MAG: hypothetical protein AAGA66_02080 [Bacteroidota bacterium]